MTKVHKYFSGLLFGDLETSLLLASGHLTAITPTFMLVSRNCYFLTHSNGILLHILTEAGNQGIAVNTVSSDSRRCHQLLLFLPL